MSAGSTSGWPHRGSALRLSRDVLTGLAISCMARPTCHLRPCTWTYCPYLSNILALHRWCQSGMERQSEFWGARQAHPCTDPTCVLFDMKCTYSSCSTTFSHIQGSPVTLVVAVAPTKAFAVAVPIAVAALLAAAWASPPPCT